jgi:uncharacterized protein YndB with AHSA1/START domain
MELKFEVQAKIKKPVEEVFEAVYEPKKLSGYFTTGGASGPLDEGKTVRWDFADVPGPFPVQVKKMIKNQKIILEWEAAEGGYGTSWYSDPKEDMVGILMTQLLWTSPSPLKVWRDFWTSAYQAIND